jgi:hypothetical protein
MLKGGRSNELNNLQMRSTVNQFVILKLNTDNNHDSITGKANNKHLGKS